VGGDGKLSVRERERERKRTRIWIRGLVVVGRRQLGRKSGRFWVWDGLCMFEGWG
jgi:hypothetical protein